MVPPVPAKSWVIQVYFAFWFCFIKWASLFEMQAQLPNNLAIYN